MFAKWLNHPSPPAHRSRYVQRTASGLMNNEPRLAILDAKDSGPFARTYGASLDAELCDWIQLIVSSGPTEENFDRLNTLAWYIFVERQGVAFGEPVRFEVSSTVATFQEFIYSLNVFSTMDIPYAEWHSMVDLLFAALSKMAQSARINFRSKECKNITEHASELLERLTEDPKFDQRYIDLLNGAL